MNRFIIIIYVNLFLIVFSVLSCKQEHLELGEKTTFQITSDYTKASYNIHVTLPPQYNSSEKYETIYTLDGNWYFDHTSKESTRISKITGKKSVIVVGVNHGDRRMTDYTPTNTSEGKGNAENFTYFLRDELIPYMENYFLADTTRSSRVILGHSAGGLYAAYSFTMHNTLFGNYLILSPAIWYDDGVCLIYESDTKNQNKANEQLVFISKAELEPTQLFTNIFYERLEEYDNTKLRFHTIKGRNHSSSANPAITEALRFYYHAKQY